jgi:hypothetical protein
MTIRHRRRPRHHGSSGDGGDSSIHTGIGTGAPGDWGGMAPVLFKVVGALVVLALGALGVADVRLTMAGTSDAVHTQSARVAGQIDSLAGEMRTSLGGLGERLDALNETIQAVDGRVTALERLAEMQALRDDLMRRIRWEEDMRSWRGRQKTARRVY